MLTRRNLVALKVGFMPDESNNEAMNRFYDAEARFAMSGSDSDRASLLVTLHEDIVLHQPETLPYGGTYRGREAFADWLGKFMDAWVTVTPTDPNFYTVGDMLISTVTMQATARHTLRKIAMPMCQVVRFADGLPIDWRNFAWDTAVMRAALQPRLSHA